MGFADGLLRLSVGSRTLPTCSRTWRKGSRPSRRNLKPDSQ